MEMDASEALPRTSANGKWGREWGGWRPGWRPGQGFAPFVQGTGERG